MSDFMPQDILPDLWEEILKTHWNYLEMEESIDKLENRKKLEDCLKEFLCIIEPDRKFFIPETARVLKNSVLGLENFNAQKGITAFESISQYANNLFTKPWRKEYRMLKLYSGFYQHEIKSNVIDAEILFEAMGYRRLSEDTLILDGPICPDQVANVSRDAMIAYVELQIMKHIHAGLDAVGIKCSWLEIYRHREKNSGSTTEAVTSLANAFQEKCFASRQKLLMADNYGYIDDQPSSNYFIPNSQSCPANCQCSTLKRAPPISRQRPISRVNDFCCIPERQISSTNYVYNKCYPVQQQYQYNNSHHRTGIPTENEGVLMSLMPHSRSLDYYSERKNHPLYHRHSFDHQQQDCAAQHQYHNSQQQQIQQKQQQQHYYQYQNKLHHNFSESPYDYIDGHSLGGGSSTISYATVAANSTAGNTALLSGCNLNPNSTYSHPYNVSGNRYPLPLNISNQLQSNNYNDIQEPTYAHVTDQNVYSITKFPQYFAKNQSIYNHPADSFQRQHSCQNEQLINLDDASMQHQFADTLQQYHASNGTSNHHLIDKHFNMHNNSDSTLPHTSLSGIGQQFSGPNKSNTSDETYVYAIPTPKESRKQNTLNSRKYSCKYGDTTDASYESTNDDFGNMASTDSERNHRSSPTQSIKDQDGVGSVELWDNVYQTVEKNGYSKDFGERKDFLVHSIDLDSLNINNETSGSQNSSIDKRRSLPSNSDNKTILQQQQQLEPKYKTRTFENAKYLSKHITKAETVCTSSASYNSQKQKTSLDNNTKKIKSAPKQTNSTSKSNTNINKTQTKSNDNKSLSKKTNNNNNGSNVNMANESAISKKQSSSGVVNTTKKSPPVASTQIIITSDNEWSCSICTYINHNSEGVCSICCHSKDFKMDSTNTTAAGTTTMAHNTPTCA